MSRSHCFGFRERIHCIILITIHPRFSSSRLRYFFTVDKCDSLLREIAHKYFHATVYVSFFRQKVLAVRCTAHTSNRPKVNVAYCVTITTERCPNRIFSDPRSANFPRPINRSKRVMYSRKNVRGDEAKQQQAAHDAFQLRLIELNRVAFDRCRDINAMLQAERTR